MKQKSYAYRNLTDKEKTNFTRIALGLAGITCNNEQTPEMIWRVFESMQKLGGKFSLRDGTMIKTAVEHKYKMLDGKLMKKQRADILKFISEGLK